MINTSINITGTLPKGLVELYQDVVGLAEVLGIRVLVVGAMARDLILVHGYGANMERGTRDVDFGINVATWDEFQALKTALVNIGFKEKPKMPHRLERMDSEALPWEIDIIPFGGIANSNEEISWPPDNNIVMSVQGFEEVLHHSIKAQINDTPDLIISVASPAGIALLKLIAWLEREPSKKSKDAADINYIITTYSKIPQIFTALFDEGHMQAQNWDQTLASASKLGTDTAAIAAKSTAQSLTKKLFNQTDKLEQLAQNMPGYGFSAPEDIVPVFVQSFLDNRK